MESPLSHGVLGIARKIGEVQAEPASRTDKHYASVALGRRNRGKRAETTHDPNDVVPFVASSCRNVTPCRNSTNGPYRTRTCDFFGVNEAL